LLALPEQEVKSKRMLLLPYLSYAGRANKKFFLGVRPIKKFKYRMYGK